MGEMNPLSIMARAEKLGVPDLQRSIQNGTIPAYIGIPMLQEKVKQAKQMQMSMAAQQPKRPSVAEQVLSESAQQPAVGMGIPALPSNLPEEGYADGGIVAFAGNTNGSYIGSMSKPPSMYDAFMSNFRPSEEEERKRKLTAQTKDLRTIAAEEGAEDLYPIIHSIYGQESSYGANPKKSSAGAVGGMQMIPGTFNQYADKGWDINNPEHNMRAATRYVKDLNKTAKGDPAKIFTGYFSGAGNINEGEGAPWKRNISDTDKTSVEKYVADNMTRLNKGSDYAPTIPASSGSLLSDYWNQAKQKASNLSVSDVLPTPSDYKEFSDYVTGASASPSYTQDLLSPSEKGLASNINKAVEYTKQHGVVGAAKRATESGLAGVEGLKNLVTPVLYGADTPPPAAPVTPAQPAQPAQATQPEQGVAALPPAAQVQAEVSPIEDEDLSALKDYLAARKAESAEDKARTPWLALMQAGLGTMAGTSPFAGVNIGQGASLGLQSYLKEKSDQRKDDELGLKGILARSQIQHEKALAKHYEDYGSGGGKYNEQNYINNILAQYQADPKDPRVAKFLTNGKIDYDKLHMFYKASLKDLGMGYADDLTGDGAAPTYGADWSLKPVK